MTREDITIIDAMVSLFPKGGYTIKGMDYSGLQWYLEDTPKPTQQEVEDEIERLRDEFDAKEYARNRETEYPKLGEQLDMLWHAIDSGTLTKTSEFYTALKAVKDKYPKSGE